MTTLYVANCSLQDHDFLYVVPGDELKGSRQRMQKIPAGGQARIYQEAAPQVIDSIIEQHARYGMVAVKEIPRTKKFVGLCYSVDAPVKVDWYKVAEESNRTAMQAVSDEQRARAAVAVANGLERETGTPAISVEVETVQEGKGDSLIARGVEVVREGVAPRSSGRKRIAKQR